MRKYTLIGKMDEGGDTFFTGKAITDVKNDEFFNHHFNDHKFVVGVPVEEFINIAQAIISGGLQIEYTEDNLSVQEAEKYWECFKK